MAHSERLKDDNIRSSVVLIDVLWRKTEWKEKDLEESGNLAENER